jgi:hypothetical protein
LHLEAKPILPLQSLQSSTDTPLSSTSAAAFVLQLCRRPQPTQLREKNPVLHHSVWWKKKHELLFRFLHSTKKRQYLTNTATQTRCSPLCFWTAAKKKKKKKKEKGQKFSDCLPILSLQPREVLAMSWLIHLSCDAWD